MDEPKQGPAAVEGDVVLHRMVDAVVYTMGKVGSSSVSAAIRAAGLRCFDVHHLDSHRLQHLIRLHLDHPDRGIIPPNLIESLAMRNMLVRRRAMGQVTKVITCIREPVGRNISAVYQNLPMRLAGKTDEVTELVAAYNINGPDEWFDNDFTPTIGLDIVIPHYDRTRGVFRFANRLFDVLVLKIETPDETKSRAISDFLGIEVAVKRVNDARGKWYNQMYQEQLKNVTAIPGDFVKRCLALKYYQAFYSDEEIAVAAERYGLTP